MSRMRRGSAAHVRAGIAHFKRSFCDIPKSAHRPRIRFFPLFIIMIYANCTSILPSSTSSRFQVHIRLSTRIYRSIFLPIHSYVSICLCSSLPTTISHLLRNICMYVCMYVCIFIYSLIIIFQRYHFSFSDIFRVFICRIFVIQVLSSLSHIIFLSPIKTLQTGDVPFKVD